MEPIVLWQQKWGLSFHVPWYLFLGGLAGGTMALGGLADLLGWRSLRLQAFARVAAWVTVPAILAGGLSLSFHLGKPERGFAFPLFFTNYGSWLTIGGWIVGVFAPVSLLTAAAWHLGLPRRWRLPLSALGVPLGLVMSFYTGLLLSGAWLIPGGHAWMPLWDAGYLPALFTLSGLSTGLAACGLGLLVAGPRAAPGGAGLAGAVEMTSLADMAAILGEAAWVYTFLSALAVGTLGQQLAYRLLTQGALAPWFWWGFVAPGLAAPIAAGAVHLLGERVAGWRLPWVLYAKFALVLVGGLLLRYVVVWGGDLKAPLPFPPSLWPVPVTALPPVPPGG